MAYNNRRSSYKRRSNGRKRKTISSRRMIGRKFLPRNLTIKDS